MDFMIPRVQRTVASLALLVGLAIAASACQKVPLLAPSGSIITLQTTATALPVNGSTDIIAQLIEPAGTPPQRGTLVSFTTTLGSIEPAQAETDISGRVVVKFLAGGGSGTALISAISGGVAVVAANALKILVGTAAVGRVSVTASPTLLPATGGASTITAQALDINGNPLSSAPVNFSTTAGTLDQGFAITDQSGLASTTLRTSTQATVTAAIGAQGGSTTTPTPPATPTTPATPGASGQASGTVTVNIAGAPTLVITPPATPPSAGIPAAFTFVVTAATTNGSAIRNVTVNWGDGQIQDLGVVSGNAVVSHTYGSQGTYTILATVTDSFGNVVPVSSAVAVNPKPQPTVNLTGPTTPPTAGTDTQFTGSVAPVAGNGSVITSVVMDFGDGTVEPLGAVTGSNIALHHVYQNGGRTYTAKLTATDSNGGVGASATTVFVQGATPLGVSLSASLNQGITTTTVTLTATVTGLGNAVVTSYLWEFGNGDAPQTTTTPQTTHTYARPTPPPFGPTVTARVTVTTSDGRTAFGITSFTP
jgi:hypothetical protein